MQSPPTKTPTYGRLMEEVLRAGMGEIHALEHLRKKCYHYKLDLRLNLVVVLSPFFFLTFLTDQFCLQYRLPLVYWCFLLLTRSCLLFSRCFLIKTQNLASSISSYSIYFSYSSPFHIGFFKLYLCMWERSSFRDTFSSLYTCICINVILKNIYTQKCVSEWRSFFPYYFEFLNI